MPRNGRIIPGCRVEGAIGPLVPNPNPTIKRRVRSRVFGTVIRAADKHKWEVRLDCDGSIKLAPSSALKFVPEGSGIPVNELSPTDTSAASPASGSITTTVAREEEGASTSDASRSIRTLPAALEEGDAASPVSGSIATTVEREEEGAITSDASRSIRTLPADLEEGDASLLDAVEEDEDVLDEEDEDSNPGENPGETPNNDFCFTHEDFLEHYDNMNEVTRHRGVYKEAWDKVKILEGHKEVGKSSKDGQIVWTVMEKVSDDVFREIREKEVKLFEDKTFSVQKWEVPQLDYNLAYWQL